MNVPDYFQIFVKDLEGVTMTLTVSKRTLVLGLKHQIFENPKFVNQTRLIYAGRQLADDKRLEDYGIRELSTIRCMCVLRGD